MNRLVRSRSAVPAVVLTAGTAIGQLAPVLALPFLTAVYPASVLGEFATYLAWGNFLSLAATLALENAAIGIADAADAKRLLMSVLTVAVFLAVPLSAAGLVLRGPTVPVRLVLFWLVLSTNALSTVGSMAFMYHKNFNGLAFYRTLGGSVSAAAQIATAYLVPGIPALVCCYALSGTVIGIGAFRFYRIRPVGVTGARRRVHQIVRERPDLIRSTLPTYLVTNLGIALPQLGIRYVFDAALAGQYFLARRVLTPPFQIAGKALGDFYFASTSSDRLARVRRHMRTVGLLAGIGVVIVSLGVWIVAPRILGEGFDDVPLFVVLLAPAAGAQLASTAFGRLLILLRQDHLRLRTSILRLAGLAAVIVAASLGILGSVGVVVLISAVGFATYLSLFRHVWTRVG